MHVDEALKNAQEATTMGYLNRYPQSCIVLAKEVKRLQRKLAAKEKAIRYLTDANMQINEKIKGEENAKTGKCTKG